MKREKSWIVNLNQNGQEKMITVILSVRQTLPAKNDETKNICQVKTIEASNESIFYPLTPP